MKKKIILYIAIVLLAVLLIFIFKDKRFYLDDKYYNNGEFININLTDLNKIIEDKESFILFTYNSYCTLKIPCENIFREVAGKYKIDFYSIPYEEFRETIYHDTVKFAPSVLLIKNGKVVAYLNAELDSDLDRYQDVNEFEKWLKEYIHLEK